jgi:hypothetical protein
MIKIAIVGSQAKYWTHEQKRRAWSEIKKIFERHLEEEIGKERDEKVKISFPTSFYGLSVGKYITFVSGACPFDGVDIWAEIIALMMGIKCNIKEPEVNQWDDEIFYDEKLCPEQPVKYIAKGYKSRNIQIAEECNILYLIDPASRNWSGGRWTYNYARDLGKEVVEILI